MVYLFQVITAVCSVVYVRGKYDFCVLVNAGLEPILRPCEESVEACASSHNFTQLSKLFCLPKAQKQFNNFEQCMGETFSNQVFGTLCGGKECTGNAETCIQRDQTCYQIHKQNNATEVLKVCKCASATPFNEKCPGENCRRALRGLVSEIGCCANGLMYTLPLDKCMPSSDNTDDLLKKDGLARLFSACKVPFPPSCSHPFKDTEEAETFEMELLVTEIFSSFPSMQCSDAKQVKFVKKLPDAKTCGSAFEKFNHNPTLRQQELESICAESCAGSIARWIANPAGCNDSLSAAHLLSWCQPADGGKIDHCNSAIQKIDPVKHNNADVESCALFALTGLCLSACATGLRRLSSDIGCCYHLFYKNSTILSGLKQSPEGISENGEIFITLLSNPAIWRECNVPVPRACTSTAFGKGATVDHDDHTSSNVASVPRGNVINCSIGYLFLYLSTSSHF